MPRKPSHCPSCHLLLHRGHKCPPGSVPIASTRRLPVKVVT